MEEEEEEEEEGWHTAGKEVGENKKNGGGNGRIFVLFCFFGRMAATPESRMARRFYSTTSAARPPRPPSDSLRLMACGEKKNEVMQVHSFSKQPGVNNTRGQLRAALITKPAATTFRRSRVVDSFCFVLFFFVCGGWGVVAT